MNYEEIFDIFKSSYVGKEIKKDIILNRLFNADDKEIIERFVTNIYIKYSVKAGNINKKTEKNFEEIQIIEININDYRAIYDIYGILLSIIPYPILAIFRYNDRVSFAVSNRILAEDKNNKGKIYTSYLIKEEEIGSYLKIDINNCQTMIDVYNKWIYNIDNVVAYYDRLDRIIEFIEIGFHIKSNEVLEKLESYIIRDCGTYNMKPKDGWKSKLDKYSDNLLFAKKVEIHSLWEYLTENTFLKNKLEDFLDWNDFKEICVYNNSLNDVYYSQYNSKMSYDDKSYDDESISNTDKYIEKKYITKRNNEKAVVKEPKSEIRNTNENLLVSHNIIEGTKNNKEIMLKLIEEKGCWCLKYASEELKNDKEFILQIIKNSGTVDGSNCVEYISKELKNDKEFMLKAIKYDPWCIQYASDKLKNDKEVVLKAVEEEERMLYCASNELKNDKDFILKLKEVNDWVSLDNVSNELKNDKNFVLSFLEYDGWSFEYISNDLKNDKDVALIAINDKPTVLDEVGEKLKNDKEFILEALKIIGQISSNSLEKITTTKKYIKEIVSNDGNALKYASEKLKNDRDVVLLATKENVASLVYASNELKNDKEFMLKLIEEKSDWCLEYASEELKNDKDFMLKAIKIDKGCIQYASDKLKNDRNFILKAVEINENCVEYASESLLNDKDFILKLIKNNYSNVLEYASEELKNNEELKNYVLQTFDSNSLNSADSIINNKNFFLRMIDKSNKILIYASDDLKNDKDFILKAIKIDEDCVQYAGEKIRNDKEFMLEVIFKAGGIDYNYLGSSLKNDKDIIIGEIKSGNWEILEEINDSLKNDKNFMSYVISLYPWAVMLEYASDELKNDKEFMLQLIEKDNNCIQYASDKLKNDKDFMLKAIEYEPWCIQYASDELKNDKEIILQCVKKSNLCIKCASDELKNDKEFMLQVVDINSEALKYLGDKLKNDKDFMSQAFKKNNSSLEYASDELKANKEFMEDINKIIENSVTLEFDYVPNNFFLCRNEKYGIIYLLEECGITVLEKNIFTMKIINKSTKLVTKCEGAPLYLLNEILEKLDTENAEYFIIDWKLNLSDITKGKLKYFYEWMRKRGMVYSIYKNNKEEKNILMEYTDENVTFQSQKSPLYRYINQNFDQNDDFVIIQLYDIQPKIMTGISNLLYLLADKTNNEYRDYIAILPQRKTFDDIWYYSMENNIEYIYILGLYVFEIPENITKQIEDYLERNNVEYQIEKEIDDILITMYPTKVEVIDFVINILESNKIVYCDVSCTEMLDDIEYAQTSLWMFEVSKKNKEEISSILSQVDQKRIDLLKELGAPDIIVQHNLAPLNCNYGIIVNSCLQNSIEIILQEFKIKYDVLDKDEYIL